MTVALQFRNVTSTPEFFLCACVENLHDKTRPTAHRMIYGHSIFTKGRMTCTLSHNSCTWDVFLLHSSGPLSRMHSLCYRCAPSTSWSRTACGCQHSTLDRKVASPQFFRKEMQASQMTVVLWQKDSKYDPLA